MKKQPNELAYYVTIYKTKGHTTWRTSLNNHPNKFEKNLKNNEPKTVVTEKNIIRIDRITGLITPLEN